MPSECALGKHQHTVTGDLEYAATPFEQLHRCLRIRFPDLGRQPGGPGLVVSNHAIANRDVHEGGRTLSESSQAR